jgi:TonB-linked SusC/RagA family outer membrane protein
VLDHIAPSVTPVRNRWSDLARRDPQSGTTRTSGTTMFDRAARRLTRLPNNPRYSPVMKTRLLTVLMAMLMVDAPAFAQQEPRVITGRVTDERGAPLQGASVVVKGTTTGTMTTAAGTYSLRAATGQALQYRYIGTAAIERIVGTASVIDVQLRRSATSLDAVVVTALGQTTEQRALGTSQQQVQGPEIAQTQRENFVNALQGRIAGVQVSSTSGTPGASTSITIRGVSSISSTNQPLMIVDGLPIDNKTLNTAVLVADRNSNTAFNNRGVEFTNRAADINPEDIETLTVLKGPEAAALYGIDAANGAIVITTKRGRSGVGGLEYNNSFRMEHPGRAPQIQHVYGPNAVGGTSFLFFGPQYPDSVPLYDNVAGFFRTGMTQKHNLSFSGSAPDRGMNYRVAGAVTNQQGVIPGADYRRVNLTGATQAQATSWLNVDLSMAYSNANNDQTYKGDNGPLLGLLVWPASDRASDYLTAAGTRRRISSLGAGSEVDNPYFSVAKNQINAKTNRIISNIGVTITPFSWGNLRSNIGADYYTNQNLLLRHPESVQGVGLGGVLDIADDITRNINVQTLLNFNSHQVTRGLSVSGLVGNAISDARSTVDAQEGTNFFDPNFVSINNTGIRSGNTTIAQRRLIGAFGQAVLDWNDYLYLTVQGRNDWTSTIPRVRNSFFYPSVSSSFIATDAFPALKKIFTSAKLRAAFAEVGRDASPYAYAATLENKTTVGQGYGYGFTGPNPNLRPEFAKSYELGTELSFLNDRLGVDATVYRKQTTDQIVQNLRGSYGTGFILFNLNGASTRNSGLELTVRATPIASSSFSWDIMANFDRSRGIVLALPNDLPESYVSDTWLYGNVRSGTKPGLSILSLTGTFYQRADSGAAKGQILIDPTTGLPIRSTGFIDAGYDRQPKFTVGLTNTFKYKRFSLNFLLDFRKGGDVFNATEAYLTSRGLAMSTLDRNVPRVVAGVLKDGKQNTANPTANSIVVVPALQNAYYTNMSEELFIEKNINWVRLRDVTLQYNLPERLMRNASVFVTGTDLFLITNYTGLDPVVNGNDAAVGGAGGVGIDYGNFPIPRGLNFGLRFGL